MINLAAPVICVGRYARDMTAYAIDHLPQHWRDHPMEPALDLAFAGSITLLGVGYATSNEIIFAAGVSTIIGGGTLVAGKYIISQLRR